MSRMDMSIQERKIKLMGEGYLVTEEECPDCGADLYVRTVRHWSHDKSYSTGYTRQEICPNCGYSEVYHDVE